MTMVDVLYQSRGVLTPAFQFLGGGDGESRLMGALGVLGQPYYEDDAAAAAAMFVSLVKDHPFFDGNKRFAVVATNVAMTRNGARRGAERA